MLTSALLLTATLTAAPALAAVSAPPAPAASDGGLLGTVLTGALALLSSGGLALVGRLFAFLGERTKAVKNTQLQGILDLIVNLAAQKVAQIFKEAVEVLKAGAADGKLTREEAAAAGRKAVEELWEALPDFARSLLLGLSGGDEKLAKATYLKPAVEQAVQQGPRHYAPLLSVAPIGSAPGVEHVTPPAPTVTPAQILAARARLGLNR